jgi:hypothetical protein
MGLLMLAAFGVFPLSAALGAIVVHDLGPVAFFPLAAAITAAAILAGLTQPSWRNLGATDQPFQATASGAATEAGIAAASGAATAAAAAPDGHASAATGS